MDCGILGRVGGWQAALGGNKGFVLVTASLASVAQRAPSSRWPLKQPSSNILDWNLGLWLD